MKNKTINKINDIVGGFSMGIAFCIAIYPPHIYLASAFFFITGILISTLEVKDETGI